jgi:hypothetical protein
MDTEEIMGVPSEDQETAKARHSPHVRDLGWDDPDDASNPFVPGLPNEELWILLRRFNKQTYHVKSVPKIPVRPLSFRAAGRENLSAVSADFQMPRATTWTSKLRGTKSSHQSSSRRTWKDCT